MEDLYLQIVNNLRNLMGRILEPRIDLLVFLNEATRAAKELDPEELEARVYEVEKEPDYDPENELWAYPKAKEWGERIPIGVIFKRPRPLLEEAHPVLRAGPLVKQQPARPIRELLADFF